MTLLAPDLAKSLAPDGVLFAGGIIEERLEAPVAALQEAGLQSSGWWQRATGGPCRAALEVETKRRRERGFAIARREDDARVFHTPEPAEIQKKRRASRTPAGPARW